MGYILAAICMLIWALCLSNGLLFDGWVHVLLLVCMVFVIVSMLRDRPGVMP